MFVKRGSREERLKSSALKRAEEGKMSIDRKRAAVYDNEDRSTDRILKERSAS